MHINFDLYEFHMIIILERMNTILYCASAICMAYLAFVIKSTYMTGKYNMKIFCHHPASATISSLQIDQIKTWDTLCTLTTRL